MSEGSNTGGRPSKYRPEFSEQAAKLCSLGATDAELADFFEVHESTLNRWKGEFPEFCESLKTAKAAADERVERSLYHRAIGYKHSAVKFFQVGGAIVREEYIEFYPPDSTALIFWLKNRRPAAWRDRIEAPAPVKLPNGSLSEQGRAVLNAAGAGDLAPGQAAQLLSGLSSLAKLVETDELVARIAALEVKNGKS